VKAQWRAPYGKHIDVFTHHAQEHTMFATSTAMFGIAFKMIQDGVGVLPIVAALLGGAGTFLIGVVGLLREYRAWKTHSPV
jgi:hypothetical protein